MWFLLDREFVYDSLSAYRSPYTSCYWLRLNLLLNHGTYTRQITPMPCTPKSSGIPQVVCCSERCDFNVIKWAEYFGQLGFHFSGGWLCTWITARENQYNYICLTKIIAYIRKKFWIGLEKGDLFAQKHSCIQIQNQEKFPSCIPKSPLVKSSARKIFSNIFGEFSGGLSALLPFNV